MKKFCPTYYVSIAGLTGLLFFSCQSMQEPIDQPSYYAPWQSLGVLFEDVQMAGIFPDSKTFVDCTPKDKPELILQAYLSAREKEGFVLRSFVEEYFDLPPTSDLTTYQSERSLNEHLHAHWDYLTRSSQRPSAFTTLIPLPEKYVVPGGRFREIYYWDSYFTMIGLGVSGRLDLFESMLDNFAFLLDTIGFIPNGNRSYYLGRSQPPYFSAMVNAYMRLTLDENGLTYLPMIQKEYDFWMDGQDKVNEASPSYRRVVYLNGTILNRYWDDLDFPRPEAYKPDRELAEGLDDATKKRLYRNLRAAAESGWDFSTRWFADVTDFSSIRTTDIAPIDLNCLIYNMELTLSNLYRLAGDQEQALRFLKLAETRYNAINLLFWNAEAGMYQDIMWKNGDFTGQITAAGFYPLYFKAARSDYARAQVPVLFDTLLKDGGLSTSVMASGQQWDMPNGWAPLQWIAIKGLEHYGLEEEADDVRTRWLRVNQKVFVNTGKMMEKYNVVDTTLLAGGGEYPTQDGFGWSNGVVLGLLSGDVKY